VTYEEAKKAAASLPESLGKTKPWVRNFGILQGLIKQR
jgi:septal ring-binding cell division protein DamX